MKTIVTTLVVGALLLVAGAVAFVYSGIYDVSASTPHGPVSSWLMETTMHSSIEHRADQVEVPDLSDESLVLAGVSDFQAMCVQCHGAPGKEPESVGKGLNPPAPDLAASAREMSAAELFWVTKNGIKMTGMPAWGKSHGDEALWPVVALLETLPELDAISYADLLARAEEMGHHAGEAANPGQAHGAGEEGRATDDHDGAPGDRDSHEAEHDQIAHPC